MVFFLHLKQGQGMLIMFQNRVNSYIERLCILLGYTVHVCQKR